MAPRKSAKKHQLTTMDRKVMFVALLTLFINVAVNNLRTKVFVSVEKQFDVSASRLRRLWPCVLQKMAHHLMTHPFAGQTDAKELLLSQEITIACFPDAAFESNHVGKGRRKQCNREALKDLTRDIPRDKRSSHRSHAAQLGVSTSTCHRLCKKEKIFVRHTSSLKPALTNRNEEDRVCHALLKIDRKSVGCAGEATFVGMFDEVHVDEKWFYLTHDGRTCILVSDEPPPERSVQHKSHIAKVMFLCAQARPRMVNGRLWDGKMGIWPVGRWGEAQKTTKNQTRGDRVWINETMDAEKYFKMMMNLVVPAIRQKWPRNQWRDDNFTIKIQQDGAKPHTQSWEAEQFECKLQEMWLAGLLPTQFKILLHTQPSNSPDANINDLAFFNALQALHCQSAPENAIELIEMVEDACRRCPAHKINHVWLTLMTCLNQILETRGNNQCKIPHIGKEKLEKAGRLPRVIDCMGDWAAIWEECEDPEERHDERDSEADVIFNGTISKQELQESRDSARQSVERTAIELVAWEQGLMEIGEDDGDGDWNWSEIEEEVEVVENLERLRSSVRSQDSVSDITMDDLDSEWINTGSGC